jgi:hypothetical protein
MTNEAQRLSDLLKVKLLASILVKNGIQGHFHAPEFPDFSPTLSRPSTLLGLTFPPTVGGVTHPPQGAGSNCTGGAREMPSEPQRAGRGEGPIQTGF